MKITNGDFRFFKTEDKLKKTCFIFIDKPNCVLKNNKFHNTTDIEKSEILYFKQLKNKN